MDDKEQISVLIRNRSSDCEIHENSQLSLYCKDCKQTICLLCRATKHEGHNCTDFQEAMQKFTEELNKFCPDLNECLGTIKQDIKKTNSFKDDFFQQTIQISEEITSTYEALISVIKRQRDELLDKLNTINENCLKELQLEKE